MGCCLHRSIHSQFIQSLPFTLQKHRNSYKHRRGSKSDERAADNQKYGTLREKSCQRQPLLSRGFWVSLHHSRIHVKGFPSCCSISNTNTQFYWCIKSILSMHFLRTWQYFHKRGQFSVHLFFKCHATRQQLQRWGHVNTAPVMTASAVSPPPQIPRVPSSQTAQGPDGPQWPKRIHFKEWILKLYFKSKETQSRS